MQSQWEPQSQWVYEEEEDKPSESPSYEPIRPQSQWQTHVIGREEPTPAPRPERKPQPSPETQQKFEEYKAELDCMLQETLTKQGYMPPQPAPLLWRRALAAVKREVLSRLSDSVFSTAFTALGREIEARCKNSYRYLEQLRESLDAPFSLLQKIMSLSTKVHKIIAQAMVGMEMPEVAPSLKKKMDEVELFLAGDWAEKKQRGVLAVHVDEESKQTILQIGVAEHGPIYITIPDVLRPEDRALKAIREMLNRLAPFSSEVDPMAVIDGSYQSLNYNEIFLNTRVVRAPSGNTKRLAQNMQTTAQRERLSPDNTEIINSVPGSREEYIGVFKEDNPARATQWRDEAENWNTTAVANRFAPSPEASREAMLAALTESQNVIVIVAHCDGQSIFLPAPPPDGSEVDANYLLAHREEIAANAPFVYLFSCEGGKLSNLQNFASTLLECGASGVVASQSTVGLAQGRELLSRLLDEKRDKPPIEDYFKAMREVNFLDMEVFLA